MILFENFEIILFLFIYNGFLLSILLVIIATFLRQPVHQFLQSCTELILVHSTVNLFFDIFPSTRFLHCLVEDMLQESSWVNPENNSFK